LRRDFLNFLESFNPEETTMRQAVAEVIEEAQRTIYEITPEGVYVRRAKKRRTVTPKPA
jgi:hypothetical protein